MKRLVVGFGNVLLGDDGFGVEVLRQLAKVRLPSCVDVMEVGISGFDLVLKLMDGYDEVVVVDAARRGGDPGSLYVFSPTEADLDAASVGRLDPHLAEPTRAMKMARQLGVLPAKITVVACEPRTCGVEIKLSRPVRQCLPRAVRTIVRILEDTEERRGAYRVG